MKKTNEFIGEVKFASRQGMANMTQSPRDDMESLYYVLTYLAGFTAPFEAKDSKKMANEKEKFLTSSRRIVS